jgi:hypothetical protein
VAKRGRRSSQVSYAEEVDRKATDLVTKPWLHGGALAFGSLLLALVDTSVLSVLQGCLL